MSFIKKILIIIFFTIPLSNLTFAKETWILDEKISSISFEVPIFLGKNIEGKFKKIQGLIEIDYSLKDNTKAIFSVNINSVEMNYEKYVSLLLSETFFNEKKFPLALIETNIFEYKKEKKIKKEVELIIKNISQNIPVILEILYLTDDLIQIKGNMRFSRIAFDLGVGNWSSTAILKDIIEVNVDLFFFRN